jgi:two-component system chemotaxis response regulator CheV
LKTLAQKEKRPIHDYIDIVISDIEMPQMDGYSLCHSVKQDQVLKALPVVLFSSLINEKLIHKGQSVGADEQITKPEAASLARRAGELIEQYRNNGAH